MCEHSAHQFLREGYCNQEIANIKRRLRETRGLAHEEMERIERSPRRQQIHQHIDWKANPAGWNGAGMDRLVRIWWFVNQGRKSLCNVVLFQRVLQRDPC